MGDNMEDKQNEDAAPGDEEKASDNSTEGAEQGADSGQEAVGGRNRRSYSLAQKAQIVKQAQNVGNISQAARDNNLSPNLLSRWVNYPRLKPGACH